MGGSLQCKRGILVILWMSLVGVAAWGIVLWDWGCGTKSFRTPDVTVAIPLKLVYTPADATVTTIHDYQVPSTK